MPFSKELPSAPAAARSFPRFSLRCLFHPSLPPWILFSSFADAGDQDEVEDQADVDGIINVIIILMIITQSLLLPNHYDHYPTTTIAQSL